MLVYLCTVKKQITSEAAMKAVGVAIASRLRGGDCLQLIGDVGAGKTTLVKGIGEGLGITEPIQSPSFTISRVYGTPKLRLVHYDFYRLADAGIMSDELRESLSDPETVVILEWADIVEGVLPTHHTTIRIKATAETTRELSISGDARWEQLT
jgi:tRNA threonylcarbamoyladenosine biosynthesis protein TsaE